MKQCQALLCFLLIVTMIGCSKGDNKGDKAGPTLSPEEAAVKAMIEAADEKTMLLESIKDETSADVAIAKLKKVQPRVLELDDRVKAIPSDKRKLLLEKYGRNLAAALANVNRLNAAINQAKKNAPGKAMEIDRILDGN